MRAREFKSRHHARLGDSVEEGLERRRRPDAGLYGVVVGERQGVVAGAVLVGMAHEHGDDVVGKVGDQGRVRQVLERELEVARVHQPEALHEDLVPLGDAGGFREALCAVGATAASADVQEDVVYYREAVVLRDRGGVVAD